MTQPEADMLPTPCDIPPRRLGAWVADLSPGQRNIAAIAFCALAAFCSTYLSGVSFPEQNNRWQIPVVLDFAGSAEGPHDAYHLSFVNFISLFWIAVRAVTTEANIQTLFIALQVAGNALMACAIFVLLRPSGGTRAAPAGLLTAFLCFCYGLWGATPLGYSEIFVTYATHTQYAISLCLLGLALIARGRPLPAGALLGIAANANLFMAVWAALAAGCALIAIQGRIVTREQIGFSALFLAICGPVTVWGLSVSKSGGAIPVSFFHDFLAGHIYGLDYPRAFAQTFALLLAAGLTVRVVLTDEIGRRLAIVMLTSTAVLAAAAAMPYLTDASLLLLLHPLRFTSIPVVLSAVCAGAIALAALNDREGRSPQLVFAAAAAVAGFVLKSPIVSVFGFALAMAQENRRYATIGMTLSVACLLSLFLPAPEVAMSSKSALALVLLCGVLTAAALVKPDSAPVAIRLTTVAIGTVATVPFSPATVVATVLAAIASILCLSRVRAHRVTAGGAQAAAAMATVIALWMVHGDAASFVMMVAGAVLVVAVPMLSGWRFMRPLAMAGLVVLVPLLMVMGAAKGARNGFQPAPPEQQRDFMTAQRWARAHTAPGAQFLPIGVEDGFSLFSRRPVWWEQSQGAAVLWQPSFLQIWSSHKMALEAAHTPAQIVSLARSQGIAYLLVPSAQEEEYEGLDPAYANAHYTIFKLPETRSAGPPAPGIAHRQRRGDPHRDVLATPARSRM